MNKNEIRALDSTIKQLASVRPYVDSISKQDRFDRSLETLINIKNDMVKTLNELKKETTEQSNTVQDDIVGI